MQIKDIPEIFNNIFSWIDEAFILVYSANIGELTIGQGVYILIVFLILLVITVSNMFVYQYTPFLKNLEKTEYRNLAEGLSYQNKRHYLIQDLNSLYTCNTFIPDEDLAKFGNEDYREAYESLAATEIIKNKKNKIGYFGVGKLFIIKIFAIHLIIITFSIILSIAFTDLKFGNYFSAAFCFNAFLALLYFLSRIFTVPNVRYILFGFVLNSFFIYIFWNSLSYPWEWFFHSSDWASHHSIIILLILLTECIQYYNDKKRVLNIIKELEIIETLEHKTL